MTVKTDHVADATAPPTDEYTYIIGHFHTHYSIVNLPYEFERTPGPSDPDKKNITEYPGLVYDYDAGPIRGGYPTYSPAKIHVYGPEVRIFK